MTGADAPLAPAASTTSSNGDPYDLEHMARIALALALGTPGPASRQSHPLPDTSVAGPVAASTVGLAGLPGGETTGLMTSAVLAGYDPLGSFPQTAPSADVSSLLLSGGDPSWLGLDLAPLPSAAKPAPAVAAPPMAAGYAPTVLDRGATHSAAAVAPPDAQADFPPWLLTPSSGGSRSVGHEARPAPQPSAHEGGAIKGDFPALSQKVNGKPLIWLDSGATTQKPRSVIDAISTFYCGDNSNVHRGAHELARRATNAYEGAREKVQRFLGAESSSEIVFVRGTTEAINLVAQSWGRRFVKAGDEILVTELEHHANIVPWQMLCKEVGASLRVVPVDDRGNLCLDAFDALVGPRTRLVAMTHVSNVLGTLVPVAPLAALARAKGARVLIDGAQAAGHLPVDVKACNADFYVVSGHKLYGPTGIGALYGRREVLEEMPHWQGGGGMIEEVSFERTTFSPVPAKFEAGTGHLAGAVGFGVALEYLERLGRPQLAVHEQKLTNYAIMRLRSVPGLHVLGDPLVRVAALPFVLDGHTPEAVAKHLDRDGIAVRAGHHCAQPILRRFGLTAAVRPSLGVYNTEQDVEALVESLGRLVSGATR